MRPTMLPLNQTATFISVWNYLEISFQPLQARRKCVQEIATVNDNRKWQYIHFGLHISCFKTFLQSLTSTFQAFQICRSNFNVVHHTFRDTSRSVSTWPCLLSAGVLVPKTGGAVLPGSSKALPSHPRCVANVKLGRQNAHNGGHGICPTVAQGQTIWQGQSRWLWSDVHLSTSHVMLFIR